MHYTNLIQVPNLLALPRVLCLGHRPSTLPSDSVPTKDTLYTCKSPLCSSLNMQIGHVTTFKLSDNISKVLLMCFTFFLFYPVLVDQDLFAYVWLMDTVFGGWGLLPCSCKAVMVNQWYTCQWWHFLQPLSTVGHKPLLIYMPQIMTLLEAFRPFSGLPRFGWISLFPGSDCHLTSAI